MNQDKVSEDMKTLQDMCELCNNQADEQLHFLDAVDNDGDALRFQHNNGSHFDVIFLHRESAQDVYGEILTAVRDTQAIFEIDIRELQIAMPSLPR